MAVASSRRRRLNLRFLLLMPIAGLVAAQLPQWSPLWGTATLPSSGGATLSGAVTSIIFSNGVLFVGTEGGGVWSSANSGGTWTPLSDLTPSLAISALAYNGSSGLLLAGTGRQQNTWGSSESVGLLVSSDLGQHWTSWGTSALAGLRIRRLLSGDSGAVWVAATDPRGAGQGGLFYSAGVGASWQALIAGDVFDVAQDPSSGNWLALSSSGLYFSTDGVAFAPLDSGSASGGALSCSAANPGVCVLLRRTSNGILSLAQTSDDGLSWTSLSLPPGVATDSSSRLLLMNDPGDPLTLWLGATDLYVSHDAGSSWADLSSSFLAGVGARPRSLALGAGQVWLGSQSGLWRSSDGGSTWISASSGLNTLALTGVIQQGTSVGFGVDHLGVVTVPVSALGSTTVPGLQPEFDHVPWLIPSVSASYGSFLWCDLNSGLITPVGQAAALFVAGESETPGQDWPASPPGCVVAGTASGGLLDATNQLWLSTPLQTGLDPSWTPLAGSASSSEIVSMAANTAYSSTASGAVLLESTGNGVLRSTDGGLTWAPVVLPPISGPVNNLVFGSAVQAFGTFGSAGSVSVVSSGDGGQTWQPMGTLPVATVLQLLPDPTSGSVLYAATSAGVWVSGDEGLQWMPLGNGLPQAMISGLQIVNLSGTSRALIAATLGRGAWKLPLASTALAVTAVQGTDQSVAAGSTLPASLKIEVTNVYGAPLPGLVVQWSAGAGVGLSSTSTTTAADGTSAITCTAPEQAGTFQVVASASSSSGENAVADFQETATAGPAAMLLAYSGDNQTQTAGLALAQPLVVEAEDAQGNAAAGATVSFSDSGAGGSFDPATLATDGNGLASVRYTTPQEPGAVTLAASLIGTSAAVNFNVEVTAPPDFALALSPSTVSAAVNQSVPLQLSITGNSSAAVNLVCLSPVTGCAISPDTVTPGATTTATVTVQSGALQAGQNTVQVEGDDGIHQHFASASVTLLSPGFSEQIDPASASIAAGQSAQAQVSVTPAYGFNGTVSLTCSGAPIFSTCGFDQSSLAISGATAASATLRFTTQGNSQAIPAPPPVRLAKMPWVLCWLLLLGISFCAEVMRQGRAPSATILVSAAFCLMLCAAVTETACGGGAPAPMVSLPPSVTPAGAYSLTITATGDGLTQTASFDVTVN